MLTNTDLSVLEIAMECGFNDYSYFIKTFKKLKGVTPKQYRIK
jgi:AraC-like DNA-binding protein